MKFKEGETWTAIPDNTPVSMNMWGFTPDYFKYSEDYFVNFLKENAGNIKAEFFIPLLVNDLIQSGKVTVTVLDTPSKWFGVTYAADRQVGSRQNPGAGRCRRVSCQTVLIALSLKRYDYRREVVPLGGMPLSLFIYRNRVIGWAAPLSLSSAGSRR